MKITLLSLLIVFCVSCGTAGSIERDEVAVSRNADKEFSSLSVNRPDWADSSIIDEFDRMVFIGSSAAKMNTEEEAKQSAIKNALGNVSKYFGVSVSATFSEKRSKINGQHNSEIFSETHSTSREINIQEYSEEDSVVTRRGNSYMAYVKIAVPKTELARLQIEVDGFGVWAIKSNIPQCEEKIRDLFPVFSGYGVNGVNINEQIDYSSKTPKQVFAENKKAFYLKIECKETKAEEYNGEFYSLLQMSMELFNLLTGETLNRWNVEAKGGAYSADDARENAITKAVQEISEQIN